MSYLSLKNLNKLKNLTIRLKCKPPPHRFTRTKENQPTLINFSPHTERGKGRYKISREENDIFFKNFTLKYQKLENIQRRKIQKLILEMIKFVKKDLNNLGRL